jgi:hypothetical protein
VCADRQARSFGASEPIGAAILPSMTAADAGAQLVVVPPRPAGCPFLLAEAGGWRLDAPSRDHRCAAFSPAAPLAPEKQARLCLTEGIQRAPRTWRRSRLARRGSAQRHSIAQRAGALPGRPR